MKLFEKVSEIISKKGVLHFRRYALLAFDNWGIYIHYFTKSDKEKDEHDHPWNFSTFVIYGGYTELHKGKLYSRFLFSFKRIKAERHHRVFRIHGKRCITLVFMGKRFREWGYVTKDGWVDHKTYRINKHK